MRKLPTVVIAIAALLGAAFPAAAESGTAQGVDPDASAKNRNQVRELVVGSDVSIGETVTTGSTGLVQLLFRDATKLVVGPSSSLLLEDYLVRNDNSAGKFAITALAGSFRFVTGSAPKDDYEITTPTGTIGVRGTKFDFSISKLVPEFAPQADLSSILLLFEGRVRLCNLARQCVEIADACDFGVFNAAGVVDIDNTRTTRAAFRTLFPFARSEASLLFPFWVTGARECLNPPPNPGAAPGALSTGGSVPGTVSGPPPTPSTTTTVPTTTDSLPESTTTTTLPSSTTTTVSTS